MAPTVWNVKTKKTRCRPNGT